MRRQNEFHDDKLGLSHGGVTQKRQQKSLQQSFHD
jgi:hypothetical protein